MIDKKTIEDMRSKFGISYAEVGRRLGISRQRVGQIVHNYKTLSFSKYRGNAIRKQIFDRYNNTCQWQDICMGNFTQKDLVIHHIDLDSHNNKPKNLILLCKKCHASFHAMIKKCATLE